jgi:hypothetical protein
VRKSLIVFVALVALGLVPVARSAPAPDAASRVLVFNGENNRLNAYDHATGEKQTVIPSAADDPQNGKDINAQICFKTTTSATGERVVNFIAGEDTNQGSTGDPGWGWFQLHGDSIGSLSATQLGKLVPTYQPSDSNPENYGCGFLSDGRLVTSDVGDQYPGFPGNGQLIVWFPPFDSFGQIRYCKVDVTVATAGGIYVGPNDGVYVASARPAQPDHLGGIYRYRNLPTSDDAAGGCGATDGTGAPLATPGRVRKELFIPFDTHVMTPSAITPSPKGTFYVSSVYNGVIAEYTRYGRYLRDVMAPPAGLPLGQAWPSGTPWGIGVAPDGTLYYADIGIVGPGPAEGAGSVQRVTFESGQPQAPEVVDEGLEFPDGIGILEVPAA